ncbi:MAG: hypothetical protein ACHQF3_07730, partial [Alphaproteobacteria bacterium]
QMIIQKSMIVVGGMGSVMGSVIGAVVMVGLLEVLREFKSTQEIVFGAVLIGFVLFRPRGIVTLMRRLPGWDEPLSAFDRSRYIAAEPAAAPPAAAAVAPEVVGGEPR